MKKWGAVVLCLLILSGGFSYRLKLVTIFEFDTPLLLQEDGVYPFNAVREAVTRQLYPLLKKVQSDDELKVGVVITPRFLRVWDDLRKGVRDREWLLSSKPEKNLTIEDKRLILQKLSRPRYSEDRYTFPVYLDVAGQRTERGPEGSDVVDIIEYSPMLFRDLQVSYVLSLLDPDERLSESVRTIVEKQRNFTENDKAIAWSRVTDIVKETYFLLTDLVKKGRVELIAAPSVMAPFPVLEDASRLGVRDDPGFSTELSPEIERILTQSGEFYRSRFEGDIMGFWPGYYLPGSPFFGEEFRDRFFYALIDRQQVSGRSSIVSSAGTNFVVRDGELSRRISRYRLGTGISADKMVSFVRDELRKAPGNVRVVSVGMEEFHPGDWFKKYRFLKAAGINFLSPREILKEKSEEQPVLLPGFWKRDMSWARVVGPSDVNSMWISLVKLRDRIRGAAADAVRGKSVRPIDRTTIREAYNGFLRLLESDWFERLSGDRGWTETTRKYFERFREEYRKIHERVTDKPLPEELKFLYPDPLTLKTDVLSMDRLTAVVDGRTGPAEYFAGDKTEGQFVETYLGMDDFNIYLAVQNTVSRSGTAATVYFTSPEAEKWVTYNENVSSEDGKKIAVSRKLVLRVDCLWISPEERPAVRVFVPGGNDNWVMVNKGFESGKTGRTVELGLPLGLFQAGRTTRMGYKVVEARGGRLYRYPEEGFREFVVSKEEDPIAVGRYTDPAGDDFGSGSITYPEGADIKPGDFDLEQVAIEEYASSYRVRLLMSVIDNPWNLPFGISKPQIDIYIDLDRGTSRGNRSLLEGRNALLQEGYAWDYAITINGKGATLYGAGSSGDPVYLSEVRMEVNPTLREITVDIPRFILNHDNLFEWSVLVGTMGYDPAGRGSVRPILTRPIPGSFGGARFDKSPAFLDIICPPALDQKQLLGRYYPQLPMVRLY